MHFIGIDIGTSAVKGVLVDAAQRVVTEASVPLALSMPAPGRFEQDPEEWWQATEAVVAVLRTSAPAPFAATKAIGLCGQMHGLVVLDAADAVIRPAILWNDGRAAAECDRLNAAVPDLAAIAGVVAMPGFTAPKLLWLKRHEPEAFGRLAHVVTAKDFVRWRMTGVYATDMADAAGMLLLDEAARDWSDALVAAAGIERRHLPQLLEGNGVSGTLLPAVAGRWGLPRGVSVAVGAGDAAAGAIGVGAVEDGCGFISLGTSAQIFFARARYGAKRDTLLHAFAHAVPGRWFEQAAMLNGAAPLDWAAGVLGTSPAALAAAARGGGPSPVFFLPHLAGERTPHNDPAARGAFVNLDHATGVADLARAVIDGIAFSLAEGQAAFGEAGRAGEPLPLVGGGAASLLLVQTVATVLGRPLQRVAGAATGPASGAARRARMASPRAAVAYDSPRPEISGTVEPAPAYRAAYAERLATFSALYRAFRRARAATADPPPAATR